MYKQIAIEDLRDNNSVVTCRNIIVCWQAQNYLFLNTNVSEE